MIGVYRSNCDSEINFFHKRKFVNPNEIVIKEKEVYDKKYKYAEPSKPGFYAFGGTILFTSNGLYPEFNTPIKLHDRQMNLEK